MPRDRIQFQKGLSEAAFAAIYGNEEQCRSALARGPEGFVCPSAAEQEAAERLAAEAYAEEARKAEARCLAKVKAEKGRKAQATPERIGPASANEAKRIAEGER